MTEFDFPPRICDPCARASGGKLTQSVIWVEMGICDCCNEFTSVTKPRYYGYPKVVVKHDREKIYEELKKARQIYLNNGNMFAAGVVEDRIEKGGYEPI